MLNPFEDASQGEAPDSAIKKIHLDIPEGFKLGDLVTRAVPSDVPENYKYSGDYSSGSTPRLVLNIKNEPDFTELDSSKCAAALRAENVLNLSEGFGYIDLSKVKKVVDFGAGGGGPTYTLRTLVGKTGGIVDAVESNEIRAGQIVETDILPTERVHVADGLGYLQECGNRGDKVDLITAFMLGPDTRGGLIRSLINAARKSLNPEGHLLINSDVGTMHTVKEIFEDLGITHDFIEGLSPSDYGGRGIPRTVIASTESLAAMSPESSSDDAVFPAKFYKKLTPAYADLLLRQFGEGSHPTPFLYLEDTKAPEAK